MKEGNKEIKRKQDDKNKRGTIENEGLLFFNWEQVVPKGTGAKKGLLCPHIILAL